jgi:Fungal specific transcription factor domain
MCIYSTHPPKESVFTLKPLRQAIVPLEPWSSPWCGARSALTPPQSVHSISTNPSPANHDSTASVRHIELLIGHDWEVEFASQVHSILTASGKNAENICRSYFDDFHPWLCFISQPDFWWGFSSSGTQPEFLTMVLVMYLLTHIPALDPGSTDPIDPVYYTAKSAWSHLQKVKEPSIVLIQAGLLLSTYESGQALEEKSRSTMVACAELGYQMRLHKSLRQTDGGDPREQRELNRRRQLWWGIVTLER